MTVYFECLSLETAERFKDKQTVYHELDGTCRCKVEVKTITEDTKGVTVWCKNGQLLQIDSTDFNYISIYT